MNAYLIADAATQPVYPAGTPSWAIGVSVVIGTLVTLVGALIVFLPMVSKLVADLRNITERVNRHGEKIADLQADQKELALYTPPPAPAQRPATPNDPPAIRSNP